MASGSDRMDSVWNHGQKLEGAGWKCNYCPVSKKGGGATRLKDHLAGRQGDVVACSGVPVEVRRAIIAELINAKAKKKRKAAWARQLRMDDAAPEEMTRYLEMGTTPAKRKMTTPNIGEEAQEQSPAVDEEQSPTTNWNVSIEPDTLECGVCFSHFETPIYQCKNGHPACVGCCTTLEKTCHVCSEPTGDIRCRPLEKVLEGMTMPCTYMKSGCKQTVKYVEKRSHEESCSYAPAHCPIHGCSYSGLQLYDHIREEHNTDIPYISISNDSNTTVSIHKNEPFRVLLHPVDGRVFLLLNSAHIPQGRSLSVVCIGPPPRGDHGLECKMEVSANPVTLSLSAQVPCVRQWTKKYRAEGFLFVPDAYWNHLSQSVSVAVGVKLLFK